MASHRWAGILPPDELGLVAHGPAILARSPGIVVGLRCVFAHPGGLVLPVVLRASGVQAEAASRQSFPSRDSRDEPAAGGADRWSELRLVAEVNGVAGIADAYQQSGSGGEDAFDSDAWYWLGALPDDQRLQLTVGWAEAGLSQTTTVLTLTGLDRLGDGVLPLS